MIGEQLFFSNAEQEVGNGALNENEERAHMGIWALAKSPIILGTDLSKIKTSSLNVLKNKVSKTLVTALLLNERNNC